MAEIREQLILEDKASPVLNKNISKMEQMAAKQMQLTREMNRAEQTARATAESYSRESKILKETKASIESVRTSLAPLLSKWNELNELGVSVDSAAFKNLTPEIEKQEAVLKGLTESYREQEQKVREIEAAHRAATNAVYEAKAATKELSAEKRLVAAQEKEAAATARKAAAETSKATKEAAKEAKRAAKEKAKAEKEAAKQSKAAWDKLVKSNPGGALNRQFMRFAATLFSVRRILSFLKNSMETMPEKAQESWRNLKDSVTGFFQSGISYLLNGMLPGMEKLNQELNSPAGQQFSAVFRELANEAGKAAGKILEGIAWLVTQMGKDFQSMRGVTGILIQGFQLLGDAVQWVRDNWSTISPIIQGVAAAVLAYKAAALVAAAAQTLLNGALSANPWVLVISLIAAFTQLSKPLQMAILGIAAAMGILNLVLNGNPILLIITAIGWLVMKISEWVQAVGGLEIAWLIALDAIKTGWDYFVAGLNVGIAWVQNLIDSLIIMWAEASTAVANAIGDMKVMALTILQNMVNGAIDIINNFISALNKIPGVNIEAVKHVTFATEAALENEAQKQARADSLAATKAGIAANRAQRDKNLNQMFKDAEANHRERQAEIIGKQMENAAKEVAEGANSDFMNQYGDPMTQAAQDTASGVGGSLGSDVSAIKKEVAMSEEELQSLVDLAQRQYINEINLTAQSPVINVQGQNTGDTAADRKALADTIRDILIDQSSAGTYRSTARVY